MNENDALKKFNESAKENDLQGCMEALKSISIDTLNHQDDDGYDMLIQATVAENVCAVIALLRDNRCDRTHEEYLCGMTADEFAMDYPEDSPIRVAFAKAPMQQFIYRNGEVIDRNDIFKRIMENTLEADKGCFDMLPADYYRAELLVNGKISKENFEEWINPAELYWEAQISLLIGDEEYGKTVVDWEYIREAADPNEWLSFLRDLPQYAHEADWEMLRNEGGEANWQDLLAVRPEFAEKYNGGKKND